MTPAQRAALRAHLLASGLSGDTRTTRRNSVENAEKLAAGDPDKALGLGARGRDAAGVMRAVAALCGCSESLDERDGPGVIDPDRTLDALEAMAARVARAARDGEAVLFATGHPSGPLPMYQAVARAAAAAGAKLLTPLDDAGVTPPAKRKRARWIRYFDGVAMLGAGADVIHTHESWPMDAILDAGPAPGLVFADHGFAGAAAAKGIETVCFNDVNDPALAVAWEDGLLAAIVPIDDNLAPSVYDPLRDYLVGRIVEGAQSG